MLDEQPETDEGTVEIVRVEKSADGTLVPSAGGRRTGLWAWRDSADPAAPLVPLRGDVRFRDVSFGYIPGQTTLHDVTLYAKPGQKIAFVGSTGAGKTTITNLINRFYDITSGTITYDGIDVRKIRKSDLRRSLGVVLQDTHLFTGTVADNIRFGKLDATDEEIIAAAKIANAHSFIERLPQGYNTMVSGDGANLSQGQRQLLAIARAAVADPPVLILDEATSSIDTRTEALIEKGMDRLMEGRTVFVIAHRLSTVRNSNAIIVLVVFALLGQQFIMAAALHNAAVFQHNNGVGIAAAMMNCWPKRANTTSCTTACLNLHKIPAKKSSHPCGRINIMGNTA